jgi:hypothetical protein
MFLTVHSSIGLTVSHYLTNPFLAFLSGFIFHYLSDIIPHGDTKAPKHFYNLIFITLAGLIDLFFLSLFLLVIMLSRHSWLSLSEIAAILGSIIPDSFQLLYFKYPKNKIFGKIHQVHSFFHNLISKKLEFSLVGGIIFQILIFIGLVITFII